MVLQQSGRYPFQFLTESRIYFSGADSHFKKNSCFFREGWEYLGQILPHSWKCIWRRHRRCGLWQLSPLWGGHSADEVSWSKLTYYTKGNHPGGVEHFPVFGAQVLSWGFWSFRLGKNKLWHSNHTHDFCSQPKITPLNSETNPNTHPCPLN